MALARRSAQIASRNAGEDSKSFEVATNIVTTISVIFLTKPSLNSDARHKQRTMDAPRPPVPVYARAADASTSRHPPSRLFPCLPSVARPAIATCELALDYAAQDNTQLYLSRLPPELRDLVDEFIGQDASIGAPWRFGRVTPLHVPILSRKLKDHSVKCVVRLRSGDRMIVTESEEDGLYRAVCSFDTFRSP